MSVVPRPMLTEPCLRCGHFFARHQTPGAECSCAGCLCSSFRWLAPEPPPRYRTIVADPPWDHSDGTGVQYARGFVKNGEPSEGSTAPPYASLTVEEISSLPISALAHPDAHLYLWTTNRYLRASFDVIDAWGFKHAATLAWCKAPMGLKTGGVFPASLEFVQFCRRGSLASTGRAGKRWWTWPRALGPPVRMGQKRGEHSAKPEAFLDLVESVSPGPYLELFARRQRLGWHTWGNEALEHVHLNQLGDS